MQGGESREDIGKWLGFKELYIAFMCVGGADKYSIETKCYEKMRKKNSERLGKTEERYS